MPVFQVDIEKVMTLTTGTSYFWTNVYHVDEVDQAAAVADGNAIVAIEKAVHAANQTFTKMRVRQVLPTPTDGTIVVLSGPGLRGTPADIMPAYCTVRCDFGKAIGRPCRKYLRLNIGESEQTNGILVAGFVTSIANNYVGPLVAIGSVCDPDGDNIVNGVVMTPVQMRQLRRGSKRKAAPVI